MISRMRARALQSLKAREPFARTPRARCESIDIRDAWASRFIVVWRAARLALQLEYVRATTSDDILEHLLLAAELYDVGAQDLVLRAQLLYVFGRRVAHSHLVASAATQRSMKVTHTMRLPITISASV